MRVPPWLSALACSAVPHALLAQAVDLDEVLQTVRLIHLEESGSHLVALPRMAMDPVGGWIYWDEQSNDVRLYSSDGSLRKALGAEGDGPGEFERVVGAVRLEDGRLAAMDSRGRVSVWTASGDSLLDDFVSGVPRPRGIVAARGDDLIAYSGPVARSVDDVQSPVLYRVSLSGRGTTETFFFPPLSKANFAAVAGIQGPAPWARGDSVFLAIPPFDSLWAVAVASPHGAEAIPISSEAVAATPSPEVVAQGPAQFRAWADQSMFAGRFFGLDDGGWLVQTWGLRRDGPIRGLVRLDRTGARVWEATGTPELLAVHATAGEILLWDPNGTDPSQVRVAREKTGRDSS